MSSRPAKLSADSDSSSKEDEPETTKVIV
jgi:hypothetical protein